MKYIHHLLLILAVVTMTVASGCGRNGDEKKCLYDSGGKLTSEYWKEYDEEGNLIAAYETMYEYDTAGRKTAIRNFRNEDEAWTLVSTKKIFYGAHGLPEQTLTISGYDTVRRIFAVNPDGLYTVYEQKSVGRSYLIDSESGNLLRTYTADGRVQDIYEYEDGFLVRKMCSDTLTKYKREYDKSGNCISVKEICDGGSKRIIYRHITEIQ